MTGYDISERAQRELDEIWTHIAKRDMAAADRVVDQFVLRFEMLARQPMIGESAGHLSPGLRRVFSGNYVIYYEVLADRVAISRILHGARDTLRIFGDRD